MEHAQRRCCSEWKCFPSLRVEVKAEHNVRSKSLSTFVKQEFGDYGLKGLRCSMLSFASQDWMDNIPLYAVEAYFNSAGLGTGE